MAIKTSERNAKKSQDKIVTLEQEVKDAEDDLRKLQERRKEIEEEAMNQKASQQTLEVTEKEMKTKLGNLKAELDAALKFVNLPLIISHNLQFLISINIFHFREENKVRAEKIDYDQKMDKFEEVIASHRAKVEHWKREMSKIKLQATDGNPAPELKHIAEEELDGIRVDTFLNQITKTEAELGKMSPNLQAIIRFFIHSFLNISIVFELFWCILGDCGLQKERRNLFISSCRVG